MSCVLLHFKPFGLCKNHMTEGCEKGPWFAVRRLAKCQLLGSLSIHSVRHDLYREGGYIQSQNPTRKYTK
jgi:hypothetical protein